MHFKAKYGLVSASLLLAGTIGGLAFYTSHQQPVANAASTQHGDYDGWESNLATNFTAKDLSTGKAMDVTLPDHVNQTIFQNLRKEAIANGFKDDMTDDQLYQQSVKFIKKNLQNPTEATIKDSLKWNQDAYGFLAPKGYKLIDIEDGDTLLLAPADQYDKYIQQSVDAQMAKLKKNPISDDEVDANAKAFAVGIKYVLDQGKQAGDSKLNNDANDKQETSKGAIDDSDKTFDAPTTNASEQGAAEENDDDDDAKESNEPVANSNSSTPTPSSASGSEDGATYASNGPSATSPSSDDSTPEEQAAQTAQAPQNQTLPQTSGQQHSAWGYVLISLAGLPTMLLPKFFL